MHYSHGQLNYPVYAYAQSYTDGYVEDTHQHDRIQLLHTLSGVIHVRTGFVSLSILSRKTELTICIS